MKETLTRKVFRHSMTAIDDLLTNYVITHVDRDGYHGKNSYLIACGAVRLFNNYWSNSFNSGKYL